MCMHAALWVYEAVFGLELVMDLASHLSLGALSVMI